MDGLIHCTVNNDPFVTIMHTRFAVTLLIVLKALLNSWPHTWWY